MAEKRKISARDLAEDIKKGVGRSAVAAKYGIAGQRLGGIVQQLLAAGLLTEQDLARWVVPSEQGEEAKSAVGAATRAWRCPACAAGQDQEYVECPKCGVIVEKFLRARQGPKVSEEPDAPQDEARSEESSSRRGVSVSTIAGLAAAAVLILIVVADLLVRRAAEKRIASAIQEAAKDAPFPFAVQHGRISVSTIYGQAEVENLKFTERRPKGSLNIDRMTVVFSSRVVILGMAFAKSLDDRDARNYVRQISLSGVNASRKGAKPELTVARVDLKNEGDDAERKLSLIITGLEVDVSADAAGLPGVEPLAAAMARINSISLICLAKSDWKDVRIDGGLNAPALEADLAIDAAVDKRRPERSQLKHARLRLKKMPQEMRLVLEQLEALSGRSFAREGDHVVIEGSGNLAELGIGGLLGAAMARSVPDSGESPEQQATESEDSEAGPAGAEAEDDSDDGVPSGAIKMKFSEQDFPLGLSVSQGSGLHLFEEPAANQGFKKFPPATGAKRFYDDLTIAGQTFLVITEESKPPKIYLDANGNGDMTDDPGPFLGEGPALVPNHYTLSLPYKGEIGSAPYRMWLFPSRMGGVRFYPKCHWQGQLDLNGRQYKIVLFDGNADGDYSNDPVVIDADQDGKAGDDEKLTPGRTMSIDGTPVKLMSTAKSGRWIRLQY